jgi:bacteriocin biosynthesis cyclodehydratase domain-containing protein
MIPPADSTDGTPRRFCIAAGLDVVVLGNDEILVQFGTRSHPSELLRDSDMTGILGRTVGRLLDGPATLADLVAVAGREHEPDVEALVQTLLGKGFVATESTDVLTQYLRHASGGSNDLDRHTVGLVGCGPLGARIAAGLAQHGITSILLGDDRPIDDIWRQFAPPGAAAPTAGPGPAAAAVCDWLTGRGIRGERLPHLLESGGLEQVVARADLTILAVEQIDLRLAHVLNRYAVREGQPWLHAAVDGNVGIVGPVFKAPETACYNEFQVLRSAATPSPAMMNRYRAHMLARGRSSFFPGLPGHADLVAAYTVLAAVHYLLNGTCFAFGRAMFVDFGPMVIDTDEVLRLPRCPVCSEERRPARPVFEADMAAASGAPGPTEAPGLTPSPEPTGIPGAAGSPGFPSPGT